MLPEAWDQNVILKVAPYAREVLNQFDADAGQFSRIADARLHQQFRRIDRAEREHDLATRDNPAQLAVAKELNAARPLAIE